MESNISKLICGQCGSTGRVFTYWGSRQEVCPKCNGIGYEEVVYEDAHTLARRREAARLASLRRFTFFLSLLAGAAVSYYYIVPLASGYTLLACALASVAVFYLIFRLPLCELLLQPVWNGLRILLGFLFLVAALLIVGYLAFMLRSRMGW